jgi:hypothetical protein
MPYFNFGAGAYQQSQIQTRYSDRTEEKRNQESTQEPEKQKRFRPAESSTIEPYEITSWPEHDVKLEHPIVEKFGYHEIVQDFYKTLSQKDYGTGVGEYPKIAHKVVARHLLTRFPEISKYPKEGRVRIDQNGNKALFYPDGTYDEMTGVTD